MSDWVQILLKFIIFFFAEFIKIIFLWSVESFNDVDLVHEERTHWTWGFEAHTVIQQGAIEHQACHDFFNFIDLILKQNQLTFAIEIIWMLLHFLENDELVQVHQIQSVRDFRNTAQNEKVFVFDGLALNEIITQSHNICLGR